MTVMLTVPRTTDEGALLAAIAASPLDDAPRLVYADWLQERGEDAKADYLRTVVALLHPPEDPAVVERCIAAAEGLDAGWRQAVGSRFEVVLTGAGGLHLAAYVIQSLLGLFSGELIGPCRPGDPIRLKAPLTREDAEAFVQKFRNPVIRLVHVQNPQAAMLVQPTDWESPLTLFAPDAAR
jgi:uncharacterized protein (TIGR02996 family)